MDFVFQVIHQRLFGRALYNRSVEYQMPPTFVPRKTAVAETARTTHARSSVFFVVSAVAFALALLAALGVFAYQKVLASRLQKMNNDLVAARAAFEPEFIYELQRMDERLSAARTLLAGHRALSPLFALLERETLATVRFVKFSAVEGEEGFRVEMEGEAAGFNAVALQSDIFSKNQNFLNPVFSDFGVDKSGTVSFRFSALLASEFTRYRTHLAAVKESPAPAAPTAPPASTAVPASGATPPTTPTPPPVDEGFGEGDILF